MRKKSVFIFACLCGRQFQKEESEAFRCPDCGRLLVLEWGCGSLCGSGGLKMTSIWRLLVLVALLIVPGCGWNRCTPDAGCTANQKKSPTEDGCVEYGGPNSKCDGATGLF